MLNPDSTQARYDVSLDPVNRNENHNGQTAPFSPSSGAAVQRSQHGRALESVPCERPFTQIPEPSLPAQPGKANARASTCRLGEAVKNHNVESDTQQRVKAATNMELTEMEAACSLATHTSSLGQGNTNALHAAVRSEQDLRHVTALLTGLEIQSGQTRHNWNRLETPKTILPSVEEITAADTVKARQLDADLVSLRKHIDQKKAPEQSDTHYLETLLRHAGAQCELLSAQWLTPLLKYVLSPLQDVYYDAERFAATGQSQSPAFGSLSPVSPALDTLELIDAIANAVASHSCASANLSANASAILENHRFSVEKCNAVASHRFLSDISRLFKTRFFAWWPQGIDVNRSVAAFSQTMHGAIEQHLGEGLRTMLGGALQTSVATLAALCSNASLHSPFHPLESGELFQLTHALKAIAQFCPWVKAAPHDYTYHLLMNRLEKYFEDPRNNPFTSALPVSRQLDAERLAAHPAA